MGEDMTTMEKSEKVVSSDNDVILLETESHDCKDTPNESTDIPLSKDQSVVTDNLNIEIREQDIDENKSASQDNIKMTEGDDNKHHLAELDLIKSDLDEKQLQLDLERESLADKENELKKREEALQNNEAQFNVNASAREENIRNMEKQLD